MKLSTGVALALLGAAPLAAPQAFQDGLSAYTANDVARAEGVYRAVAADAAAEPKARSDSLRELGRIAWLVDGDADGAVSRLREAEAIPTGRCETGELLARVLRESAEAEAALRAADRSLPACDDPAEADELLIQAALAHLELARREPTARERHAAAARLRLERLSEDGRTGLPASAAALRAAIVAKDATGAFAAWRGYFWLGGGMDAPQALTEWEGRVQATFSTGLADRAPPEAQAELARLLARAGFLWETEWLAERYGLARRAETLPSWRNVRAYLLYRGEVERTTLALNRSLARGGSRDPAPWLAAMERLARTAMAETGTSGDPKAALAAAFGLYGTAGETGGYPSAHIGHVVRDERRRVEQYGRTGEIRFIVVDNMLTNGFESWLWDGRAAAGGWADGGTTIVQVRQAYAGGPMRAWRLTHDTPARRRGDADAPELERRDLEVLARSPVGYLPGVAARLRRQAIGQILETARREGGDLRLAFLRRYEAAVEEHSIFIHEGRHVLDQGSGEALDTEALEYRAKLSELALAQFPRLPLAGIDNDTIGTDTPHGRANARILTAYAAWMRAHAEEIEGLDRTRPLLAQLDRLSDTQIRAVARGLDPWASSRPGTRGS